MEVNYCEDIFSKNTVCYNYEVGEAISGLFYMPDGTKSEMEKAVIYKLNK